MISLNLRLVYFPSVIATLKFHDNIIVSTWLSFQNPECDGQNSGCTEVKNKPFTFLWHWCVGTFLNKHFGTMNNWINLLQVTNCLFESFAKEHHKIFGLLSAVLDNIICQIEQDKLPINFGCKERERFESMIFYWAEQFLIFMTHQQ